MRFRLAAIAAIALLAAACGSGGGSGGAAGDAATVVPADALAYLTVDTDLSSGQLQSARSIIDKFPIRDRVLQQIRSSLATNGTDVNTLKSSIGPEVDVAVLSVNGRTNAVGFTQPVDEKTFDAQLDKKSTVHTKIDGWTAFAGKQAFLDAVKNLKTKLSDDAGYQAAAKTIPASGDAIVRFYASGSGLTTALGRATAQLGQAAGTVGSLGSFPSAKWIAGALTSQSGAFKLEVHAKSTTGSTATSGGLADEIPSGSILALQVVGGGTSTIPANLRQQLGGVSQQLGVDLPTLLSALNGPLIAYVRAGLPLPEVTIAAKPAKPEAVDREIGKLITRFAHVAGTPAAVDGGTLTKADLGSVALYHGVNDGQLVITDSPNALAELKGSAGHLTGDAVFKEAKDGAGMPDAGQGFLFVNLKDALPAVDGFAQLANQTIPPSVEANLKPLRSLLVYGSRDADVQSFVVYLKTS